MFLIPVAVDGGGGAWAPKTKVNPLAIVCSRAEYGVKGFAKRCYFHWPLEKRREVQGGEDFRNNHDQDYGSLHRGLGAE